MARILIVLVFLSLGSGCSGCDDESSGVPETDSGNNTQDLDTNNDVGDMS